MKPRERVMEAIERRPPDVPPLRIYAAKGGLYEHGQKLVDRIKSCGHDFGDFCALEPPEPPPDSDFDEDGSYHAFQTDEWGVRWEFRIFGIWGHPVAFPLDDLSRLDDYRIPDPPATQGEAFERDRANVERAKERFFTIGHGGGFFERLHSLRRFEDVLADIATDEPAIHELADRLVAFSGANVRRSLALGVDAVSFGDDFGTQTALLMSPAMWRNFFKPRYERLFQPIRDAGKTVFFHCCGKINPILPDLREVGVDVIWPQLPAFDLPELTRQCRELGLAIELHPDRGNLMQHGTPAEIRDTVLRLFDTFGTADGGSWLYIEIDPGFPWANVEALFDVAMEVRGERSSQHGG
jgi:hypothetical protein